MIHAWMQLSQSEKCEVTTILCVAYSKLRMTYHSEDENIIEMIMFSQRISVGRVRSDPLTEKKTNLAAIQTG